MLGIGFGEFALIFIVLIVVLGPERLPAFMKSVGKGLRTLRQASRDIRTAVGFDELMRDPLVYEPPPRPKPQPAATPSPVVKPAAGTTATGTEQALAADTIGPSSALADELAELRSAGGEVASDVSANDPGRSPQAVETDAPAEASAAVPVESLKVGAKPPASTLGPPAGTVASSTASSGVAAASTVTAPAFAARADAPPAADVDPTAAPAPTGSIAGHTQPMETRGAPTPVAATVAVGQLAEDRPMRSVPPSVPEQAQAHGGAADARPDPARKKTQVGHGLVPPPPPPPPPAPGGAASAVRPARTDATRKVMSVPPPAPSTMQATSTGANATTAAATPSPERRASEDSEDSEKDG